MAKEKRLTVRIPEYLDKQIFDFACKYFNRDYSKALRFLCQLGLILSKRLGEESIKDFAK